MGCLKLTYYNGEEALEENPFFMKRGLGKKESVLKNRIDYYAFGSIMPGRKFMVYCGHDISEALYHGFGIGFLQIQKNSIIYDLKPNKNYRNNLDDVWNKDTVSNVGRE